MRFSCYPATFIYLCIRRIEWQFKHAHAHTHTKKHADLSLEYIDIRLDSLFSSIPSFFSICLFSIKQLQRLHTLMRVWYVMADRLSARVSFKALGERETTTRLLWRGEEERNRRGRSSRARGGKARHSTTRQDYLHQPPHLSSSLI